MHLTEQQHEIGVTVGHVLEERRNELDVTLFRMGTYLAPFWDMHPKSVSEYLRSMERGYSLADQVMHYFDQSRYSSIFRHRFSDYVSALGMPQMKKDTMRIALRKINERFDFAETKVRPYRTARVKLIEPTAFLRLEELANG